MLAAAKSLQSCPTLCDPIDGSPPGSAIPGILQTKVLEWGAIAFSVLTPYTKINSKWIKDLNIRPETIKLLEENIGKTLSHINHSRILYDPPPRIMEIKSEINKWDLIKKLLHNEGNYKQGENTAFRMGGK